MNNSLGYFYKYKIMKNLFSLLVFWIFLIFL